MATATVPNALQELPIEQVIPTKDNPRKIRKTDEKFKELVRSIKTHGVLQPVLVRPTATGYDLRAGERRYQASKAAGLKTIPAIVREMTDAEAFEVTVIENLQREDLKPIEEARGIQSMLDHGWTLDQAAAQLGKSVAFVARRARLTALIPEWAKAMETGRMALDRDDGDLEADEDDLDPDEKLESESKGDFSMWSVAHWELIARLPSETQYVLFQDFQRRIGRWNDPGKFTLRQLDGTITEMMRLVKRVPWSPKAEGIAGICACAVCPKRSSVAPELFDGGQNGKIEEGDKCLDPVCWEKKLEAYQTQREAELREKHSNLVLVNTREGQREAPNALASWNYQRTTKKAEGAIPAMVADDSAPGQLIWIRPRAYFSGQVAAASGEKTEKTVAEKKEQYDKLRRRIVAELLSAKIEEMKSFNALDGLWGRSQEKLFVLIRAVGLPFSHKAAGEHYTDSGDGYGRVDPWEGIAACLKNSSDEPEGQLIEFVEVMHDHALEMLRLRACAYQPADQPNWEEIQHVTDFLGIDLAELEAKAAEQKPYPRSWKSEAEALNQPKADEAKPAKKSKKARKA